MKKGTRNLSPSMYPSFNDNCFSVESGDNMKFEGKYRLVDPASVNSALMQVIPSGGPSLGQFSTYAGNSVWWTQPRSIQH